MNKFLLKYTEISRSELDFTRMHGKYNFEGPVEVSVSIGTPKDAAETPVIQCKASFYMGGPDKKIEIRVQTTSIFDIVELDDEATLADDAKEYCGPITEEELTKKIRELTELHIGRPIEINIPKS